MKIAITSDVHLEFGPLDIKNEDNVDVLVLSGDILTAKNLDFEASTYGDSRHSEMAQRYHDFLRNVNKEFPNVIYIMGNHEHYNFDFKYTESHIRNQVSHYENIHFLEKQTKVIDDVTFIGGTMWTTMNNQDPLTLQTIRGMMNDFRCVRNSNRMLTRKVPLYKKDENGQYIMETVGEINRMVEDGFKMKEEPSTFCPEDAVEDHFKFREFFEAEVGNYYDKKIVMCTHHTPSRLSCHPRYKDDSLMNGGYHNDLEEYIMDHPQIKLWTHGHTHEDYDYMLGTTRVVCNPRGYINYESRADRWKLKIVEV